MRYSEVLWVRSRNVAETSARLSEESEKRTDHRPALRFIKVSTSSSLSPDTLSRILQRLERDALVQKEVLLVRAIFRVSQLWSKPLAFFGVQPAQPNVAISH